MLSSSHSNNDTIIKNHDHKILSPSLASLIENDFNNNDSTFAGTRFRSTIKKTDLVDDLYLDNERQSVMKNFENTVDYHSTDKENKLSFPKSESSNHNNNHHKKIETELKHDGEFQVADKTSDKPYRMELVWRNIFLMIILHSGAIYGFYLILFYSKLQSIVYLITTLVVLGFGVTCGAHRLWSHRTYEASFGLRVFLMLCQSAMLQNDLYEWCRDHRVHHKFSETDADPHNSKRGFFFAHMGWLMCKKHPDVASKGKTISLIDLEKDPVVQFQRQFYKPLAMFCTFYVPTIIPYYFWGESYYIAFFMSMFRYALSLHATWCVNSVAHLYGERIYDKAINPVETRFVEILALGEGYHNYHHVFPYDYSASEMSWDQDFNMSTMFIDFCVKMGWAWNCKKVDKHVVENRVKRTGDQSMVQAYHHMKQKSLWHHTVWPFLQFYLFFIPFVLLLRWLFGWPIFGTNHILTSTIHSS